MNFLYSPPRFLRTLTSPLLCWHIQTREKKIFLTFDDGPTPGVTEKVLEILAHHRAKATFFVLGKNASEYPELVERTKKDGHAIGSHGWDHLNGWKTSRKGYLENAGRFPFPMEEPLFRPPYGRMTPAQARALKKRGYRIIMWSVLSRDYDPRLDRQKAFRKITSLSRNGSILVFHDSNKAAPNCLDLLPKVLSHFSQKGFAFETLIPGKESLARSQQNNDIFA